METTLAFLYGMAGGALAYVAIMNLRQTLIDTLEGNHVPGIPRIRRILGIYCHFRRHALPRHNYENHPTLPCSRCGAYVKVWGRY